MPRHYSDEDLEVIRGKAQRLGLELLVTVASDLDEALGSRTPDDVALTYTMGAAFIPVAHMVAYAGIDAATAMELASPLLRSIIEQTIANVDPVGGSA